MSCSSAEGGELCHGKAGAENPPPPLSIIISALNRIPRQLCCTVTEYRAVELTPPQLDLQQKSTFYLALAPDPVGSLFDSPCIS